MQKVPPAGEVLERQLLVAPAPNPASGAAPVVLSPGAWARAGRGVGEGAELEREKKRKSKLDG